MVTRSTSNSPGFQSIELQRRRPNSVAVAGALETLVRSIHAQQRSSPCTERKELEDAAADTKAGDLPAGVLPNATAKTQLHVESRKPSDKVAPDVSTIPMKRKESPTFQQDVNSYKEVLEVEEAVTCSKPDSAYNLIIVRSFLEELINRVQSSQNKTVVSWESVRQRFYDMMTGDECPDLDLLGRYQQQIYFFQYSLDEKVLEEWTGKQTVAEVFALPEFEGIQCFMEAYPPHNLFVAIDKGLSKSGVEMHSVAVSTDDFNNPSITRTLSDPFDLLEFSYDTDEVLIPTPVHPVISDHSGTEECTQDIDAQVLEPKPCLQNDITQSSGDPMPCSSVEPHSSTIQDDVRCAIEAQLNSSGSTEHSSELLKYNAVPKTSAVAPEPSDLPDPNTVFKEMCLDEFIPTLSSLSHYSASSATHGSSESERRMNSNNEHPSSATAESQMKEDLLVQLGSGNGTPKNYHPDGSAFLLTPDMSPVEDTSVRAQSLIGVSPNLLDNPSHSHQQRVSTFDGNDATRNSSSDDSKQEVLLCGTSRAPSEVKQGLPMNSTSPEATDSKDAGLADAETPNGLDPSLMLLMQAGIYPREMLEKTPATSELNVSQSSQNSAVIIHSSEPAPICFRVSQVDASVESQQSQEQLGGRSNETASASQNNQAKDNSSKRTKSILDDLKFPDINGEAIKYLTRIRQEVFESHERRGIIPRLENILASLNEPLSYEWIDYVLCYIPDVSVMPVDGQVFVAWKGKPST
uniref:DUF4206 domain-containing protein n=1 Tax=Haemonchus contortus TaxID=6289 RepID=A0A7I4YSA1_HAECO